MCLKLSYNLEVDFISIKNDLVLEYIEALPEGEKVSVRELSAKLRVSEGTAYKAVKAAEQLGLVVIKPKAGTVRISAGQPEFENSVSAADTVRLLGLGILAGKQNLNRQIQRLVICDGGEEAILRQLKDTEAATCLCLCGDRPELQTWILEKGANLLLTCGAKASWTQMNLAERQGLLILSSPQSAYSLVRLFDTEFARRSDFSGAGGAAAWMQTPDYLYYNDVVADWQRLFMESSLPKQYPVVDDNLELFGSLDIWKASSAVPSQKLRSVMAQEEGLATVKADERLSDIARRFVIGGDSVAAVLEENRVLGIITSNDLLRYYMYAEQNSCQRPSDSFLVRDSGASDLETIVYRVRIPQSALENIGRIENDLLVSAAESHLRQLGCQNYRLESGTFISPRPISSPEGLMLLSRIQSCGGETYTVETEIYDESASYAKMIVIAAAHRKEMEK